MDPIQAERSRAPVVEQVFAVILGHEGGYTNDRRDPGNWTGGKVGVGELRGTRYGVSAAAYPTLDIANLTLADAAGIFDAKYFRPVCGASLPPPLALIVADAAYNNGTGRAARWLQQVAGTAQDGQVGKLTLAALDRLLARPDGLRAVCTEFMAQRLHFMAGLAIWPTFGLGWSRRLCALPFDAMTLSTDARSLT